MDWVKGTESNDESGAKPAVPAKLALRTELLPWMAMYQRLVQASTVKASSCSTARAGICFRAPCDLVFVVDTRGDEEKAAGLRRLRPALHVGRATAASWVSFLAQASCPDLLVLLGRSGCVVLRAVGAGHVEDDLGGLGVYLFGDGGESAEKLVGDV